MARVGGRSETKSLNCKSFRMQNTSFGAHGRRKQQFLKGIYWKIEVLELSAGGGGRAATKNSNFKKEIIGIEKHMVAEFASGSGMYPVIQHTAPDTATALQCMPLSSINAFRGFFWSLATIDKRENFIKPKNPKKRESAERDVTTTNKPIRGPSQIRRMCRQQ